MQILPDKKDKHAEWKLKNSEDAYSAECFRYAEAWADLMEKRIEEGAELQDIAKETSHEADTTGISFRVVGKRRGVAPLV